MAEIPKIESLDDIVEERGVRVKIGDYVGPLYKKIYEMILVGDKLAYRVDTAESKMLVNFDGVEGPKYRFVGNLKGFGDKLTYMAETENGKRLFNIDGVEGPKYDGVIDLVKIGDKFAYSASYLASKEGGREIIRLINFDGKEIFDKTLEELKEEYECVKAE